MYHDPSLCTFIETAGSLSLSCFSELIAYVTDLLPDVYATPWFITLFSSKLPLDSVYQLWDIYFVEDDPFLHLFFTLSLLISNRDLIFESQNIAKVVFYPCFTYCSQFL
jgi:hypothetical protein